MSRCLVLGYNRSDGARVAARWPNEQLLPDGKLVIVHSCRDLDLPASPGVSTEQRPRIDRDIVVELLLEGEDEMFDVDVEIEVTDADPVSALCDAAVRHSAEAIVVGTERHSRVHTAIGTVTVELLRLSPVPVIVVPLHADGPLGADESSDTPFSSRERVSA